MYKNIAVVCGARPNFMKVAPLCKELEKSQFKFILINTGQHFDRNMADDFFDEFEIFPDYNFSPCRKTIISQFSSIANSLDEVYTKEEIDLVIVVGDVNSTLIGALVANKLNIKVAHIESGLRSYNRQMPEEYNRLLTDQVSDYLFTTSEELKNNLIKEGINEDRIYFVGNIMMDTLCMFLPKVKKTQEDFYFCTLHRAENVDNREIFSSILDALEIISKDCKIYLPLHPRTRKRAMNFDLLDRMEKIFDLIEPLKYSDSIYYQKNAKIILTDSGGIQEESTYLGTPCLTLRTETERPVTIHKGTNMLGGVKTESILKGYQLLDKNKRDISIKYWDGNVSKRIIEVFKKSK